MGDGKRPHWDDVYATKGEAGVSWYEPSPTVSLELIRLCGATAATSLIDVGGGASHLVDHLIVEFGLKALAVLDLSAEALALARARLGVSATDVDWIVADVRGWAPARRYDIWHDRAAFHFMTTLEDREAYLERLRAAVEPGGHAIIGAFAPDGPAWCSGLPVARYDSESLVRAVGPSFQLVGSRRHMHATPWGATQAFQFSVLQRVESGR